MKRTNTGKAISHLFAELRVGLRFDNSRHMPNRNSSNILEYHLY